MLQLELLYNILCSITELSAVHLASTQAKHVERVELGFTRVIPKPPVIPKPVERNKTRMLFQAWQAVNDNVKHVNGVKGPSIAALIPSFNTAES